MIVVRKLFASIFWFIVFVVLILAVFVAYTLSQVDLTNEAAATAEAERMGQEFGARYGLLMFFGSMAVAVLGSVFGLLPFSRHNKR